MKAFHLLHSALLLPLLLGSSGDDPVVARATDQELTRSQLADWLVVRMGPESLGPFAAEELTLRLARERGLLPTEAEVDAAVEEDVQHQADHFYDGSVEDYFEVRETRGYTTESWKLKRKSELRAVMAQANLARADRVITDEELRAAYVARYGDLGERTAVEVCFFSAYRGLSPLTPNPDVPALRAAARERADAARERLAAGAPLAEILPETDVVSSPFVVDGVVTSMRKDLLGKEVDKAVSSLDEPGDTSLVVDVFDGSYVLRLLSREPVRFDDVRPELVEELRQAEVTGEEFERLRRLALQTYGAEMLPGALGGR